ncbi:thiol reductant ABC exporter subunit CydC [Pseudomonas sp. 21LCFQ010]|uniref:thiol reductant ABC exporter subunit CydC n=1 Tax=Pseudomonas sp. 21LCFQ010 TaxID=2957506 RepID=UPI002097D6BD|nr:thiol reductant ABC exporter subunit CydC [Pseudomonas sp. 21LCFQ010]MCO8166026.1 thiol reductant ABC exporter subunit CydC [Pseudomonas sp. 21LCFQ010]
MSRKAQRPALYLLIGWFRREGGCTLQTGVLLAAITALCSAALLGLSGWFISATALAGVSVATALVFDVFMPSAGIRLFALGRTFSRYAERLVTHDVTLELLARMRVQLFCGWARPGAARRLALRPARLLFRLTCDVDALDSLYLRIWLPLGTALVAVLAVATALLLVDARLGVLVLVYSLVVSAMVMGKTASAAVRPAALRACRLEKLRGQCSDLVAGQTELLMSGQVDAHCQALLATEQQLRREDDRLQQLDAGAALGFGLFSGMLVAGVMLATGWLVADQQIDVPLAVLGILLTLTLGEPLLALRRAALEVARSTLAAKRVSPQLVEEPAGVVSCDAEPVAGQREIVLQGVHVRHDGAGGDCLRDINLQIAAGERVALIGSSGAGKSSLMAALTGELQIRQGELSLGEYGWLTQRTELFRDTVRDNLLLARPSACDEQLWQVLGTAGLASTLRQWPQGLDTRLGEGGLGLSGGQARRLTLARLLLRDQPVWLLDEPTEGLDNHTASEVLRRLSEQGRDRTWLLATHLRREARLADRLVLLRDGRIVDHWWRGSHGYDEALEQLRPD